MKKGLVACVIASLIIGNPFWFNWKPYVAPQHTSITGKVSPTEAAETALLIIHGDTLRTPFMWGNFLQQVQPGTYKLIVAAKVPFKNVSLTNLVVKKNHVLDVGELILQK